MDGAMTEIQPTQQLDLPEMFYQQVPVDIPSAPRGAAKKVPFGRLFGTRSGDKGGAANCGVWAKSDEAYGFLHEFLTVDRFKTLLPDFGSYEVERYELPNMLALNFVIRGVLGGGVSSNHRIDKQAKSLGEYLRAKHVEIPESLLA